MTDKAASPVPRALKPHVIVDRFTVGSFHKERTIVCRCGWRATHYNAGRVKRLFDQHKANASTPDNTDGPVSP